MIEVNKIIQGDCKEVLKTFPDNSVDCCITSPPYYGLRDYGTATWEGGDAECKHSMGGQVNGTIAAKGSITTGVRPGADTSKCRKCGAIRIDTQLGLEATPELYIANMVEVFTEVKRVLKKQGTLWLNLGSSYVSKKIVSEDFVLRENLTDKEYTYATAEIAQTLSPMRDFNESAKRNVSPMLHNTINKAGELSNSFLPKMRGKIQDTPNTNQSRASKVLQPFMRKVRQSNETENIPKSHLSDVQETIQQISEFVKKEQDEPEFLQPEMLVQSQQEGQSLLVDGWPNGTDEHRGKGVAQKDINEGQAPLSNLPINTSVGSTPHIPIRDISEETVGTSQRDNTLPSMPCEVSEQGDGIQGSTINDSRNTISRISITLKRKDIPEHILSYFRPCYILKPKDDAGIPWRVAFALQASGWYLRQDIIWSKKNPMPSSVTDRCTTSHEYIFLMSKSSKYYFDADAIKTEIADTTIQRLLSGGYKTPDGWDTSLGGGHGSFHKKGREKGRKGYEHRGNGKGDKVLKSHTGNRDAQGNIIGGGLANKRSVWTVNTMPFNEFSQTVHWQHEEQGEPCDGNLHIMSVNCPNYGGLFDFLAMVLCGEHEGDLLSRILDTCNYLSLEPKDGYVPIEMLHELKIWQQNLDYFLRQHLFSAIDHSNRNHKTALFLSTNFSCTPSVERYDYIQRILTQHGLFALSHDNDESNILLGGFPDSQLPQTLYYIVGKLKLDAVSYGVRYKKVTKKIEHFATFPERLVVDMIKAGCPEGGVVLDPFFGAGTTGLVARKLHRNFIGIELNESYIEIANKRLFKDLGLFK